jgi:carbohydrate-binding DOMON domain-containing protein
MASISFTNPTSSSVLDKESTVTISWQRSPASGTWGTSVLYLYRGTTFVMTIVSNLNSSLTSYQWTIPESVTPASNYTIQVHTTHDDGGGGSP